MRERQMNLQNNIITKPLNQNRMKNGKKPAFTGIVNEAHQEGLTKREYFAGLAMQGLMTSQNQEGEWRHDIKSCAEISVQIADALLAELEKNNL